MIKKQTKKQHKFMLDFLVFAGPRLCIGEPLARMELFLIFTNLIQKFKFLRSSNEDELSMEGIQALTLTPIPYEVTAIPT